MKITFESYEEVIKASVLCFVETEFRKSSFSLQICCVQVQTVF